MKKLALLMGVLAFAGCTKQGGTEDQYNSDTGRRTGTSTTTNNTYSTTPERTPIITDTNSSGFTSTNTPPRL